MLKRIGSCCRNGIRKTGIPFPLIICVALFILLQVYYVGPPVLLPASQLKLVDNPVENLDSNVLSGDEENSEELESTNSDFYDDETFTILLFTFKYKRMDMVNGLLNHLNGFPNKSQVLVIWSNPGNESVPTLTLPSTDYPLRIFITGKDSLNVRFSPLRGIKTKAVFILDDDTFIDHQFILYAFNVWKMNPERIVGFKARGIEWDVANHQWKYERHPLPEKISIVLTGSAFIHRRYLWLYTYKMPGIIREWIENKLNCEDIAMNFLISNFTQKAPIPVLSEAKIFNPFGHQKGISSTPSHFEERTECLNFFLKVYGRNPLKVTPEWEESRHNFEA